jgi:GNAT superfamily N-acetyltransferase
MALLSFRYATLEDASALGDLASKTFEHTYRDLDDPQEIADYIADHFNLEAVRALLRDPHLTTLLAEADQQLAGYAVLAQKHCPPGITVPAPMVELWRFYLSEQFIGKGHGAQLMLAIHREARRCGTQTIWLGVYDRNTKAVNFYERFGFSKVGGKEFMFGGRLYIDPVYAGAVRADA